MNKKAWVNLRLLGLGLCLSSGLFGCSTPTPVATQPLKDGPPDFHVEIDKIPQPVPKPEPRSRYGNQKEYVVNGKTYRTLSTSKQYKERGLASWYGKKFHGRRTSSWEPYDMLAMTAAHRELPLPTYVKVTNLENQREVIVRVNDRGPFVDGRIIDLSYAAAKKLGIADKGVAMVEIEAIDPVTYTSEGQVALTERYYLQLGAFRERSNAERLAQQLQTLLAAERELGPIIHVEDSKQLYRVRVGPFSNVDYKLRIHQQLIEAGFEQVQVVMG